MKNILLSMKPFWFEKICSGKKIYEYRKRFLNEPVRAYIYVSAPVQAICAIVYLDKKILLDDWLNKYNNNIEVSNRIKEHMLKNKCAMPILKIQTIEPIKLEILKFECEKFIIPESYYYLDKYREIFEVIKNHTVFKYKEVKNDFTVERTENICVKYDNK